MSSMYVQSGIFNIVLLLIVWNKVFQERNQFRDCRLFSRLLIAVFCVIMLDTLGWILDGKLLGELRLFTNVVDGLNLVATAAVCWCWVQYVQYLAFEDAGIPGHKNYLVLCFLEFMPLPSLPPFPPDCFIILMKRDIIVEARAIH